MSLSMPLDISSVESLKELELNERRLLAEMNTVRENTPRLFLARLRECIGTELGSYPNRLKSEIMKAADQLLIRESFHNEIRGSIKSSNFGHALKHALDTIRIMMKSSEPPAQFRIVNCRQFEFWRMWWLQEHASSHLIVKEHPVVRGEEPLSIPSVPQTCEVMRGHPWIGQVSWILVRSEYKELYEAVKCRAVEEPGTGMIIAGHPGIGKAMFLYYVLCLRLLEGKTTILQNEERKVLLFTDHGTFTIPGDEVARVLEENVWPDVWALIDSTQGLTTPCFALTNKQSPLFILEAASSRTGRRGNWVSNKNPVIKLFMKPWSIQEIIVGRPLQQDRPPSEQQLLYFFDNYGPSAGNAYACAGNPADYVYSTRDMIGSLKWSSLRAIIKHPNNLCMDSEATHRVVLIQPKGNDRQDFTTEVISKTVFQMVLPFYFAQAPRNAQEWLDLMYSY